MRAMPKYIPISEYAKSEGVSYNAIKARKRRRKITTVMREMPIYRSIECVIVEDDWEPKSENSK